MADKVLATDTETWLLLPAVEVLGEPHAIGVAGKDPIEALTADLVNEYLAIQTRASAGFTGAGGNITISVKDDAKLALIASATDGDKAINASGNIVRPTTQNYDAKLTIFRDKNLAAVDSNYNVANDSVRARGARYIAFRRISTPWTTAAVAGEKYNAFYVQTDHPIDMYGDGNNQTIDVTLVTKSVAVEDGILQ